MLPAPNPIGCKNKIDEVLGTGLATVCLADADGLKGINDRYGHIAGDQYLEHVFETLKECFPEFFWDRYGGDEFVGVSPGKIVPSSEQAKRETVQIFNQPIKVGYSLGVVHTAPNDTVELAMAMADAAMYEAKHVHHGGLLMFEPVKNVGLIQSDWQIDWYIPLVREKIRFFLGYEQGTVDFVFSQNPDIQEGIFVDSPGKLRQCIFDTEKVGEPETPSSAVETDEFGEWGIPIENVEWRTKVPESEWERQQDDQPVQIRLERDGGSVMAPTKPATVKTEKPPEIKPQKVHTPKSKPKFEIPEQKTLPRKRHRFSLPDIAIPSLPSFPGLLSKIGETGEPVPDPVETKGVAQGEVIWVWGERGHEIDYAFAQYLSGFTPVLYLDGDLTSPQHQGNWSDCWVIGTPAVPPSEIRQEGNLMVWGLGKRPSHLKPANIKALWENALYSLNTPDRAIIVGAGKMAPPPHVDRILFVTEKDVLLVPPAMVVNPSEKPEKILQKFREAGECGCQTSH